MTTVGWAKSLWLARLLVAVPTSLCHDIVEFIVGQCMRLRVRGAIGDVARARSFRHIIAEPAGKLCKVLIRRVLAGDVGRTLNEAAD
mmetsp:Transcript_88095/g.169555  ORF Transcript_88095/g.169555 Transcript_88095/m.169555 type:complete len:87 (-) Transcript_88095:670-930(-)